MRPDAEILWEVASGLARAAVEVSRPPLPLPPLLFFTDPERTPRPWETAAALPTGSGVVFRHFAASDAIETADRLRQVTSQNEIRLLIGLDIALAKAVGADGVHLPERALGQAGALRAAQPDWLVTGAVHSAQALSGASSLHAAILSPVFPAGGASATRPALGGGRLAELVRLSPCPVYALGGIHAGNAHELAGSGVVGLAGVEAIQAAFGPA
ncbi:thiamine phosphate synthase [Brevundimonas kwangchunensis]|uniref:Thiamine phosphate synthase n=1 Tax=Brevundimonas kwangchunensis TaxID=322163 RepID=A0ABN1GNT6_9CAUL